MNRKSQLVSGMGLATQMITEIVRLAEEPVILQTEYLQQVFVDENIFIGATDGTRTIANAKDVFVSFIDPSFVKWGLDVPGQPTKVTKAIVYEITNDGTFAEVFGSLKRSLDSLCWTQSQIVEFAKKYRDRLCEDRRATLFLFKVGNEFFVAGVHVAPGVICVGVDRFSNVRVWGASCRSRFAVPKLTGN